MQSKLEHVCLAYVTSLSIINYKKIISNLYSFHLFATKYQIGKTRHNLSKNLLHISPWILNWVDHLGKVPLTSTMFSFTNDDFILHCRYQNLQIFSLDKLFSCQKQFYILDFFSRENTKFTEQDIFQTKFSKLLLHTFYNWFKTTSTPASSSTKYDL